MIDFYSGFSRWCSDKESACQCRGCKRPKFDLWVRKVPWSRKWQPVQVFSPGKGVAIELDITEQLNNNNKPYMLKGMCVGRKIHRQRDGNPEVLVIVVHG